VAGRIVVLAGAGKSDLVGAGDGQVDGVIAQRGVGCLDGGAQGDDADGRYEQVGGAVDVEDRRHTALFERFQVGEGPALAGRCLVLPLTGPALEPLTRVREHGATPLGAKWCGVVSRLSCPTSRGYISAPSWDGSMHLPAGLAIAPAGQRPLRRPDSRDA